MSNEKKQNFELDFRVTHGSVEETFETMKNYQQTIYLHFPKYMRA